MKIKIKKLKKKKMLKNSLICRLFLSVLQQAYKLNY